MVQRTDHPARPRSDPEVVLGHLPASSLGTEPRRALDLLGVGVTSLAEQRHHLRLGDPLTDREVRHAGKAASHPDAGSLALLAVVVAEAS